MSLSLLLLQYLSFLTGLLCKVLTADSGYGIRSSLYTAAVFTEKYAALTSNATEANRWAAIARYVADAVSPPGQGRRKRERERERQRRGQREEREKEERRRERGGGVEKKRGRKERARTAGGEREREAVRKEGHSF